MNSSCSSKAEVVASFYYFLASIVSLTLYIFFEPAYCFITVITSSSLYFYFVMYYRKMVIINLEQVFLLFFIIYSITFPLSYYLFPKSQFEPEVVYFSYLLCLFANIGYAFGLFIHSIFNSDNRVFEKKNIYEFSLDTNRLKRSGYITFMLGVIASFMAVMMTVGMNAYLTAGYAGRALIKREAGPIELGLYISVVGAVIVFCSYLLAPKKLKIELYILVSIIVFFFAYVSFLGVRRPSFLMLLALFSVYCVITRKVKVNRLLLYAVPLFLFFTTFAQYRQVISSSGVIETVYYIQENASLDWFDFSETELGAPFKTLYHISSDSDLDYRYGLSYLSSVLYVLPSFINGGMQSLSVEYTYKYFSSDFISIGGNMGYFPVTEAYVNFGVLGPVFMFCLIAIILAWLNRQTYRLSNIKVFRLVLFAIAVPWIAFFMRLDFSSFMKGFVYSQLVPLIFAYFIYNYKLK